ncbi:MAG: DUF488 domain-containing protein [Candidatus Eremiobacterota bacterium]
MTRPVYTIGHSNHSLEGFVGLLQQHGVQAVADVRSQPYSRFHPQFNQQEIKAGLSGHGIAYSFLGRELGARSPDPSCYDEQGRVHYDRLAGTEDFQRGIRRVLRGRERFSIALMCAEREPLDCHRTLLVSQALAGLGVEVRHIHGDGSLETHPEVLRRLLSLYELDHEDLFRSEEERLREARRLHEQKIAYTMEEPTIA